MKPQSKLATRLDGAGRRMAELVPEGTHGYQLKTTERAGAFDPDCLRLVVKGLGEVASDVAKPHLQAIEAWGSGNRAGSIGGVILRRTGCNYGSQLLEGTFLGSELSQIEGEDLPPQQRVRPLIRLALKRDCPGTDRVVAATMSFGTQTDGRQPIEALPVPLLPPDHIGRLPIDEMTQLVEQADRMMLRVI